MPPLRTMPAIKPTKTERSHEENQERAYIAASRRSDRSLEARVESARRASEIHEKRTGRKLRVTEQDVINEEMYEEEDDNVPWRYRHLALLPNLSTLSPEFRRRVEAQLVLEMERSRMVDPNSQFQSPGPYLNPNLMQMHQFGQQNPMFPPSMYQFNQQQYGMPPPSPSFPLMSPTLPQQQQNRASSTSHRTSPYPTPNAQSRNVRPTPHQRSASIATPQESSANKKQRPNSSRMTTEEERRNSLPPKVSTSPVTTPTLHDSVSPRPHSLSASPLMSDPTFAQPHSYPGAFHGAMATQAMNNPYAPLTPSLPMNTQQILSDGMFGFMDDTKYPMLKPNASGMNQPMYNYNPNGTSSKNLKKRGLDEITTSTGLDQTLMPTALDTSVSEPGKASYFNNPYSASSNYMGSAVTDPGYNFGFQDDEFGFDMFKSSQSSPHPSPAEFNSFVHDDMFNDQQFAF